LWTTLWKDSSRNEKGAEGARPTGLISQVSWTGQQIAEVILLSYCFKIKERKTLLILISNNPRFFNDPSCRHERDVRSVLLVARNLIHQGYRLLNHPKYGNLQPVQWYYRTLILTSKPCSLDLQSLNLIEESIHGFSSAKDARLLQTTDHGLDYQLIDYDIVSKALLSLDRGENFSEQDGVRGGE